jgi:DNA modification methylase
MKEIKIKCQGADVKNFKQLKPFQGELKSLSTENYNKLKKQILDNGFTSPIHVWINENNLYTLDGHQRCRVLTKMSEEGYNIPSVPIDYIQADTHAHAKRIILAHTSQYGKIEEQGLYEFMHENDIKIDEINENYALPEINIDKFDDNFFNDPDTKEDEVPDLEEDKPAIIKLGDLIELGNHRLLCGDSTVKENVDKLMGCEKADMVFTDPPYGVKRDKGFSGFGGFGQPIARKKYEGNWDNTIPEKETFELLISLGKISLIFGGNYFAHLLPKSKHWLVWDKKNTMPTFGDAELIWTNVERDSVKIKEFQYNGLIGKEKERFHATQKPIGLLELLLNEYSEKTNCIIDLFGGSGSTLIACEKTNRKCLMMELDEKYCDVIISRYCNYTNNNDIIINGEKVNWQEATKKN